MTCQHNTKTETCLPGPQSCRGRCQDDPWFLVPASGHRLHFWGDAGHSYRDGAGPSVAMGGVS